MWIIKVLGEQRGYVAVDGDRGIVWARAAQDGQAWELAILGAALRFVADEFGPEQYTGHYFLTARGWVIRIGDLQLVGEVTPTHTNIPVHAAADVAAALEKLMTTGAPKPQIEVDSVY